MLISNRQDIITGDEIVSDSYDIKEVDGAVYEVDCKKISVGGETFGESFAVSQQWQSQHCIRRFGHRSIAHGAHSRHQTDFSPLPGQTPPLTIDTR